MSTYLEQLSDDMFAPLTVDEQDAMLGGRAPATGGGGKGPVIKASFTLIGATQVSPGTVTNDYVLDG